MARACPQGRVLVLIAASKQTFKLAESLSLKHSAINTIRRYAADDAHDIYGTAYDETLGDQLRVNVIATGLSSSRKAAATPPQLVVQHTQQHTPHHAQHHTQHHTPQQHLRTGTDNIPVLNQVAQAGTAKATHAPQVAQNHSDEGLNTPSVWRTNRTHAAAKVDALASNGMDEIEIPAFLRKQAD